MMTTTEKDPKARRRAAVVPHVLRLAGWTGLAWACGDSAWALVVSVPMFFAAFSFAHDLVHAALGLPRRVREPLLALVAGFMLLSGHGMRITHLLHHRRPLEDGDYEGAAARLGFFGALRATPALWWQMRTRVFGMAKARDRRWLAVETAANVITLAVLVAWGPYAALFGAALLVLQVAMPFWAGYLSHRTPAWMLWAARKLAFTKSPAMLSLAYHDLHHARPAVPCHRLGALA